MTIYSRILVDGDIGDNDELATKLLFELAILVSE